MKRGLTASLAALVLSLAFSSGASAAVSFSFTEATHKPSKQAPGTINRGDEYVDYSVKLKNSGTDPTTAPTKVALGLPTGLKLHKSDSSGWSCNVDTNVCQSTATVAGGAEFPLLELDVWIFPDKAPDTVITTFAASGGGAASEATAQDSFSFGPGTPFGLISLTAGAEDEAKAPYTQAGGHPFSASSAFTFATKISPANRMAVVENLRDLFLDLPAGFLGNPEAVPSICTVTQVRETTSSNVVCPEGAAVGGIRAQLGDAGTLPESSPLYRITPEAGYVAAFAFRPVEVSLLTVVIRVKVRSNGDYGVSVAAPLPPQEPELLRVDFATLCSYGAKTVAGPFTPKFDSCKKPLTVGSNPIPFLTMQTKCSGGEPVTTATVDSYQNPGSQNVEGFPDLSDSDWKVRQAKSPAITGCNQLDFDPSFEGRPTTNVADAPTGLDFKLQVPQEGLVEIDGLATPHLDDTTVVLPEGMRVNPSAAGGLEACSSAQIGLTTPIGQTPIRFSGFPANCPNGSKIGSVEVSTPLLDKPLQGSVYLAKQFDNPFNSLLALYIALNDPETGIVIKLAGKVSANPQTGQLTTVVEENPQAPFEELDLKVFEGARAPLRTPSTCGTRATEAQFTPYSAPESGPPASRSDSFAITTAPGSGACPTATSQLPNAPRFSAGTITPKAGLYSPFVLRLSREDGSQELKGIDTTLPPGLTGRLAGVPYCSEAALALARSRSKPGEGALEQASPSCPAASELGSVDVGAGAGPLPYHASGRAYLAGPYKGAPVSMVVITPAVAGPFDLGSVVVRNALYINPVTAQVTVVSDPIPTILEGIPLDVRSIEVRITRNSFTLNPTSCNPMAIGATAFGLSSPATLSQHFQVGECATLKFKPDLKIDLRGGTKRGDYQRLKATVTYPEGPGYANIARAAVTLPHSAFLAQEHINTVCTRVQFAAKACPQGSIYGNATAITPLLDQPLSGPVYLRSSNNPLPDLVVALKGPDSLPIEVELAGRTDSKNEGIRNTFDLVPDAPVSKFVLELLGGKKSLIVNSRDLCKGTQRATVRLSAQNGMRRDFRPVVGNSCGKKGKKGKGKGKKGGK